MSEVTQLLQSIDKGDTEATSQLLEVVYTELRRIARSQMSNERPNHTLEATALVHEAYLRLMGDSTPHWDSRGHFFSAAAEAMRRILVEHARSKKRLKRGGNFERQPLEKFPPLVWDCDIGVDLLDLDEALERLYHISPDKADLVKLLYFAGLNLDEAAAAQGISRTTAYRHWQFARAWLRNAIQGREE